MLRKSSQLHWYFLGCLFFAPLFYLIFYFTNYFYRFTTLHYIGLASMVLFSYYLFYGISLLFGLSLSTPVLLSLGLTLGAFLIWL